MKLDKNIYNNTLEFFKKRFFELIGLILLSIFLIFLYSLFTYSPENSTTHVDLSLFSLLLLLFLEKLPVIIIL